MTPYKSFYSIYIRRSEIWVFFVFYKFVFFGIRWLRLRLRCRWVFCWVLIMLVVTFRFHNYLSYVEDVWCNVVFRGVLSMVFLLTSFLIWFARVRLHWSYFGSCLRVCLNGFHSVSRLLDLLCCCVVIWIFWMFRVVFVGDRFWY